jgi:hypothetical protein
LGLFHQCLANQSLTHSFMTLLESTTQDYPSFSNLANVFAAFSAECLRLYSRELRG